MIREQLDTLFSKEMSRKEFLQHIGSGMLIFFGVTGLINALTKDPGPKAASRGYGSSAYGGMPTRNLS